MSTVLLADQVLTLDAKGTIYTPGAVTFVGTEITAVGPPPERPTGEVVDLRGCVLLPRVHFLGFRHAKRTTPIDTTALDGMRQ